MDDQKVIVRLSDLRELYAQTLSGWAKEDLNYMPKDIRDAALDQMVSKYIQRMWP